MSEQVRQHECGSPWITEVADGSVFLYYAGPACHGGEERTVEVAAGADPAPLVLAVDDHHGVRALLAATLELGGFRFAQAADGARAWDLIVAERPRLVLLDAAMPGLDGFELCRRIKADRELAGTAVVLVTALVQDAARDQATRAGADAYLAKPFSPLALLALVRRLAAR